jgi:hypothetical protein
MYDLNFTISTHLTIPRIIVRQMGSELKMFGQLQAALVVATSTSVRRSGQVAKSYCC